MKRALHVVAMTTVNMAGAAAFLWPFLAADDAAANALHRITPYAFAVAMPLLLLFAASELLARNGDVRRVAMIAALAALATAVRPLGAGVAGLEPMWAILLWSGRALGATAGYVTGALAMVTSAMLTGGVGPWLPYQMFVAAWVGALAGCFPRVPERWDRLLMSSIGGLAGLAIGALLNLWFWPVAVGLDPAVSYVPGAGAATNLQHWMRYGLLTSMGFDLPRAAMLALLMALASRPVLSVLRRSTTKARFLEPTRDASSQHATMRP